MEYALIMITINYYYLFVLGGLTKARSFCSFVFFIQLKEFFLQSSSLCVNFLCDALTKSHDNQVRNGLIDNHVAKVGKIISGRLVTAQFVAAVILWNLYH